jgi:uncharacterized RDD family membrane protein YckC
MINDPLEQLERERLQLASIKKRALAFIIDEILLSAVFMIMLWDQLPESPSLEEIIVLTNAYVMEYMAMKIVYQTLFVYQYGASIGKIMMKIRIVELRTFDSPVILSAFNRGVFRIVSEMLFYIGFVWATLNPARQTWHDRTAGTVVVDA